MRENQGLTESQLEQRLNMRKGRIQQLELAEVQGKIFFYKKSMNEIAQALGCRFKYILTQNPSLFDKKTLRKFESIPSYPRETKDYLQRLLKSLKITRTELIKALKIPRMRASKYEEMERNGNIFYEYVDEVVQALGCQIKYILLPDTFNIKKMKPREALYWSKLEQIAALSPKPLKGWFRFIRDALEMNPSELAKRIQVEEEIIIQIESDEVNKQLIQKPFLDIAQVLGCRFEYIIIPYNLPEQICVSKQPFLEQEFLKKLERLSHLPKVPSEGWIRTQRIALGISQDELGKKINTFQHSISQYEIAEKEGRILPESLKSAAQMLDCRIELIFIPENFLLEDSSQNTRLRLFPHRKATRATSSKKPLHEKELPSMGYEGLSSLPLRPQEGWIRTLRKGMGLTQAQLAKRANLSLYCIYLHEKKESESSVWRSSLKKVAEALGCQFEYFLIPNTSAELDKNFKNFSNNTGHFKILKKLSFLPQRPSQGWIQSLRLELGLSQSELSKKANLSQTAVFYIEMAERQNKIIPPSLKKIAQALGCKVEYFFYI